MPDNIIERAIVPYNPSSNTVRNNNRYNLFAPIGGANKVGMAGYNPNDFEVDSNQIVSISATFKNSINTELGNKVDKIPGKGLSTNDLTNTLKGLYDDANIKKHIHSNKSILDNITAPYTTEEKNKLEGIAENANNYSHPSTHAPSIIVQDSNNRFVSDSEKSTWNNKVDKVAGKGLSANDYTSAEKAKLAAIEDPLYKGRYTSYAALVAANPTGISGNFAHVDEGVGEKTVVYIWDVSDEEWQEQQGESAEMTPTQIKQAYESNDDTNAYTDAEKIKLAGIANGANNYTHPANHPASIIEQDANNRFVTDAEKNNVSTAYEHSQATGNPHGTMASDIGAISTAAKGAANGVASLDGSGKVPNSQLPTSIVTNDTISNVIHQHMRTHLRIASGAGTFVLPLASGDVSHTYSEINKTYLIAIRGYYANAICDWGDGSEEIIDFTGGFYYNNATSQQTLEIWLGSNCCAIGDYAFAGCSARTIDLSRLPIEVTSIGDYAFADCSLLESIKIPSRVTIIGTRAFSNCRSLKKVDFDEASLSLTTIGAYAFVGCRFTSIYIPGSVTTIGNSAFSGNPMLQSMILHYAITDIPPYLCKGCLSLSSVVFARSSLHEPIVSSIGAEAFADCRLLDYISLPASVTSIGVYSFSNCIKLTTIEFQHTTNLPTTSAANRSFANCKFLNIIASSPTLAREAAAMIALSGGTLLPCYRLSPGSMFKGNATVAVMDWASDATYADYGYRAAVTVTGMTANYTGIVNFADAALALGTLKEGGKTYTDGFYIYASEIPAATISIESYVFWEV